MKLNYIPSKSKYLLKNTFHNQSFYKIYIFTDNNIKPHQTFRFIFNKHIDFISIRKHNIKAL